MDDDHRSYRGRNAAAALFLNVSRRLVVAQIHGVMAAATMLWGCNSLRWSRHVTPVWVKPWICLRA